MSYKSPRDKLLRPRGRNAEQTRAIIPEVIRLPDGREFLTRDILVKPRDRLSYNLRTGTEYGLRTRRKIAKKIDTPPEIK